MPVLVSSAVRSCLGDGATTFAGLLAGRSGVGPLRHTDPDAVNVGRGYHVPVAEGAAAPTAAALLAACLTECLAEAFADVPDQEVGDIAPVPVFVGTGLRELGAVERAFTGDDAPLAARDLHFASAVAKAWPERGPRPGPVITLANACSASGHALALAEDAVTSGGADLAVAAGTDVTTTSMLAMIGLVAPDRTVMIRPFDRDRTGVLLGEGAAVVLVAGDSWRGRRLARLLGTGLSCDAQHETQPSPAGMRRAADDALARAGREPADVGLVVAHGTGTALNDVAESQLLLDVFGPGAGGPVVTGIKGALGHTSGASALMSLDVAVRALAEGVAPPIVGLRTPLAEGAGLRLAAGAPHPLSARVAQVNAFGFGGVNSVSLVEVAQ